MVDQVRESLGPEALPAHTSLPLTYDSVPDIA
jgi:hypothetical protein